MNTQKIFLISMISALITSAVIAISVLLFGKFGETELKLLFTTIFIGGYSFTGLCCSSLYEKKIYLPVSFFGIGVSVIGLVLALVFTWCDLDELLTNEVANLLKVCGTFAIFSFSFAHISLLLPLWSADKSHTFVNLSLYGTIASISIVALMLINLILNAFDFQNDFYFRALATFAILDVLGTIVTCILNKIASKETT